MYSTDVPAEELAGYCVHALAAAGTYPPRPSIDSSTSYGPESPRHPFARRPTAGIVAQASPTEPMNAKSIYDPQALLPSGRAETASHRTE